MSRWYTRTAPDGQTTQRYMSVTTILDIGLPKPALKQWAANMAAEYALDNLDVLKLMVERGDRDAAYDTVKMAHNRRMKRAALRGSQIHKAVEAFVLQKPYPGVPENVLPVYRGFLKFLEEHRPTFEATEAQIFNDSRRFAGTFDALATMPSLQELFELDRAPRVMIDWKAKPAIYPDVALQLSAYVNGEVILTRDGQEHELPDIDGAIVVRLDDDDYDLIPVDVGEEVFRHFLYICENAKWMEERAKTVLGKPVAAPEKVAVDQLEIGDVPPVLRPCPECGDECEEMQNRESNQPRWKCTNEECRGGKNGKWPWASWDKNPWAGKLEGVPS